jgi:hypothetical protein
VSVRVDALRARLPDPAELGPSATRLRAPEEIRLSPIEPLPPVRARDVAGAPMPDRRALDLLRASVARLGDLEPIVRAQRPEVAAALGPRLDAIRALAAEVRTLIACRDALEGARRGTSKG